MAKILHADDDPSWRSMIGKHLARLGHEAHACEDGQKAVEALTGDGFDLVVTDGGMPKMGGLQLLEHIRQTPALANVPVIVVTGDNIKIEVERLGGIFVNKGLEYGPMTLKKLIEEVLKK